MSSDTVSMQLAHPDADNQANSANVDDKNLYDKDEDLATQTPIQNRYTFWYHRRGKGGSNYEEGMTQLASFQTIEHFWRIYNHMIRPNDIKTTTDYHLFKYGVSPTWEDPVNKNGGKWMVRLKKGLTSRLWEELILAIIGEQFDVGHEICGAVVSVRHNEDIISVWNKTSDNNEATQKIRESIRRILKMPGYVPIEYKTHNDALNDKSSFRNPNIVHKATSNANNRNADNYNSGSYNRGDRGDRGDNRGGDRGGDREGGGGRSYNSNYNRDYNNPRGGDRGDRVGGGYGGGRYNNNPSGDGSKDSTNPVTPSAGPQSIGPPSSSSSAATGGGWKSAPSGAQAAAFSPDARPAHTNPWGKGKVGAAAASGNSGLTVDSNNKGEAPPAISPHPHPWGNKGGGADKGEKDQAAPQTNSRWGQGNSSASTGGTGGSSGGGGAWARNKAANKDSSAAAADGGGGDSSAAPAPAPAPAPAAGTSNVWARKKSE